MKKLLRFLFPTWEAIEIDHYIDVSYGMERESTTVIWKSSNGTLKKKIYWGWGYLTEEDLAGAHP